MKPLSPAFILLLMLAAVPAAAGHLPYNMETISVTDGLCSNNVYAVVQDQVGYMWFGTDNGLDRYDGKTLKHYVHDSENNFSLTSSTINCLIYSDCFGLLAGTENGICRYVPEKDMFASWFSEVTGGENVRTFFEEPDSTLWIGTNNGLYRVDAAGDEIINYNMSNSGVSHNIVRAIYADDRYVFVATFDGVSRMEKSTGKWINLNLKKYYIKLPQNNLVLSILQSPWDMDVLYIGMQTGFCVLDKNTMEYSVHDMSSDRNMCNNTVKTICQVKDELWLGTEEGVMIYRDGGFSSFGYDPDNLHSLPNNIVWQVYKDRNDIVWLATEGGVAHYDAGMPNFDKYDLTESTGNPYVGISFFAAASDWSGRIWLGSRFGLASYSRESNTTRWVELSTAVPGTYNFVRGLYVDRNDILWVGTAEGVLCYDTRLDREVSIQPHLKNRLKYINVMKNLDNNGILVCDVFGRVQIIRYGFDSRNRKIDIVSEKSFSIGEPVEAMEYDGNFLWFGTAAGGLLKYDSSGHRSGNVDYMKNIGDKLVPEVINCIYCDRKSSSLWVGTDKGIFVYDPDMDLFSIVPGLSHCMPVYSIVADDSGLLWITTSCSVICYDSLTSVFKTFPLNHWLDSRRIICPVSISKGADVFIFGMDVFMRMSRTDIRKQMRSAPLCITDIKIDNRPFSEYFNVPVYTVDNLELGHDQNMISFCFSMLDYTAPDITTYTYKLEGYDDSWKTVTGVQDYVEYTKLKPGNYVMKVSSVSSYGLKASNELALNVKIRPPWWSSRIAVFMYFLLVFSIVYYIAVMVRKRRIAEEELQKEKLEKEKNEGISKMKMHFFTNVSHDFRTPLSLIISPVESMLENETDFDKRKKLQIVIQNARRLLRLVNQILDFKKVEEQKMKLCMSSGDLVSTIGEICWSFKEIADKRGISLHFESGEEHLVMDFDKDKIDKIFVNLISNAVKFTNDGGQVLVSLVRKDEDNVEIMVADTGVGIPDNAIPHIFERFYQVEEHVGLGGEGTGIGLMIVKEFVDMHHGHIEVLSKADQGSSFIVTLPIVNESADRDGFTSLSENVPEEDSGHEYSVLIVEDNEDMLSYLKFEFGKHYKVYAATSAEAGLKVINDEMPDLVISDIMLPGMSGIDLCRKIKGDFVTNHIPVILLTARTAEEHIIEGYDAGADEYIGKPFNMKVLLSRSDNMMKQRQHLRNALKRDTIEIEPVDRQSPDEIFIKKVVSIIEENIADPELDIPFLCDRLAVSHVNFYRKVRSITGTSANVLIREIRLKKAAQLLRIRGMSVTDVMYDVGFNHRSYFSKCFREQFGITPKNYAKKFNNDEHNEN